MRLSSWRPQGPALQASGPVLTPPVRAKPEHLLLQPLTVTPDRHLKMMFSRSNGYSMMPVVGTRTRSTSCWVGR